MLTTKNTKYYRIIIVFLGEGKSGNNIYVYYLFIYFPKRDICNLSFSRQLQSSEQWTAGTTEMGVGSSDIEGHKDTFKAEIKIRKDMLMRG